jgi:exoribonuclease R
MDALEGGGSVELVDGGFVSDEHEDDEEAEDEDDEPDVGVQLPGLADLEEDEVEAWLQPFQQLLDDLDQVEDERLRELIHLLLLGCMGRAFYTPDNIGHFGLGSTCYLHFTSPIRRYPDLVAHRQLKHHLADTDEDPPHDGDELVDLCPRNSDQAVEAEQLERDLIAVAMAFDALTDDANTTYSGLVNGITKGGVFLSLERGLEARLPTSDIPGGPWEVDDAESMLFRGEIEDPTDLADDVDPENWRELYDEHLDEMVQVRLRLGDEVKVQRSSIDLAKGQIAAKLAGSGPTDDDTTTATDATEDAETETADS